MEFELDLQPSMPTCCGKPSLQRLKGLQAASITLAFLPTATSTTATAQLMDDRHGLIRAVAALVSTVGLASPASKHPCCQQAAEQAAAPAPPAQHARRRLQLRARRVRGSSTRPATASVSVAAGDVASSAATSAVRSSRQLQQLLAGGVAGAVSKTLVAPLERVSTMLMTDGHRTGGFSLGDAVAHAWRDGGVAGLFRGNAATLAKIFPASAIQFAVFHGLKDALLSARSRAAGGTVPAAQQRKEQREGQQLLAVQEVELTNAERFLAGAAAGAASVSFTYPLESMRTLMSVAGGMEGSLFSVCRRVVASGGVRALYRGFQATLMGDVLGNALGFSLYEIGNRMYKDANSGMAAPPSVRGVIGAMSAACTITFTMPLEVVRRRLQIQGTLGRPVLYSGTLDCFLQIVRKEGLKGFYHAALPSYLKVAPSIGAMYFLYELLTKHLDADKVSVAPATAQEQQA